MNAVRHKPCRSMNKKTNSVVRFYVFIVCIMAAPKIKFSISDSLIDKQISVDFK